MKKLISLLTLTIIIVLSANAQELTSKKGFPILPEKGDFGLGIDAVPLFEYMGNFFHGSSPTYGPTWDYPNSMYTIQGKYFLEANKAIRGKIRIGYNVVTEKNLVVDQDQIRAIKTGTYTYKSPNVSYPLNTVEDKRKTSDFSIVLGAGLEKRRGKGRVQGVYGAMVNILMGNSTQKMTYGNKMDTGYYFIGYSGLYPDTNNISFHRGAISTNGSSWSGSSWSTNRVTSTKDGFQFGIGANVFLGVEYFFAPKMSLGGEFSWGFLFSTTGQSTTEGERIKTNTTPDGSTYHTVSSYEEKAAGSSFFGIDNSNTYGAINLTFYF